MCEKITDLTEMARRIREELLRTEKEEQRLSLSLQLLKRIEEQGLHLSVCRDIKEGKDTLLIDIDRRFWVDLTQASEANSRQWKLIARPVVDTDAFEERFRQLREKLASRAWISPSVQTDVSCLTPV